MIQFVPFTTMIGCSCFSEHFIAFVIVYWLFVCFFSFLLLGQKHKGSRTSDSSQRFQGLITFEIVITLICGLSTLYFCFISGFRINLNILMAYDLRTEGLTYSTIAGSTYLLGLSRILIPVGLTYSIKSKKLWMVALFFIFFVFNYSFDGSKTLFFVCLCSVFVALFYKRQFNKYIPFFLNLLLIVGYVEFLFNSTPLIYNLLIRRLFFVPNIINNAFFDYMSSHSPNMFSNLLRFLGVNNSYDISFVIGDLYFHSQDMSANTGTIGDAIWQFRWFGAIILPFLIVLILKFFDFSSKKTPFEMLIIPCLVFSYYLNNSSFTAACFSHGLVFFCLVIQTYKTKISLYGGLPVINQRLKKE